MFWPITHFLHRAFALRRRRGRIFAGLLPQVEALETRAVPTVTASFNPGLGIANGTLTVTSDNDGDTFQVSNSPAAQAFVVTANGAPVVIARPAGAPVPTGGNTRTITINGGGGNDTVSVEGLLFTPAVQTVNLNGDAGDDQLTGSLLSDRMFGGAGNDILSGENGSDLLDGGADNDTLIGGAGDDQMAGGAGNDEYFFGSFAGSLLDPQIINLGTDGIIEAAGGGIDTLNFSALAFKVSVDLSIRTNQTVSRDAQSRSHLALALREPDQFENVIGTDFDDVLLGNALANLLRGGAGNDLLRGRDGNDDLNGDDGDDILCGEGGTDSFDGGREFRAGKLDRADNQPGEMAINIDKGADCRRPIP